MRRVQFAAKWSEFFKEKGSNRSGADWTRSWYCIIRIGRMSSSGISDIMKQSPDHEESYCRGVPQYVFSKNSWTRKPRWAILRLHRVARKIAWPAGEHLPSQPCKVSSARMVTRSSTNQADIAATTTWANTREWTDPKKRNQTPFRDPQANVRSYMGRSCAQDDYYPRRKIQGYVEASRKTWRNPPERHRKTRYVRTAEEVYSSPWTVRTFIGNYSAKLRQRPQSKRLVYEQRDENWTAFFPE